MEKKIRDSQGHEKIGLCARGGTEDPAFCELDCQFFLRAGLYLGRPTKFAP
jgi:hypothetical protein